MVEGAGGGPAQARPLPERIGRLHEMANNLWWSWKPEGRELFRLLDYPLWVKSVHNPVKVLRQMSERALEAAAKDPAFLTQYDRVLAAFEADMAARDTWYAATHPNLLHERVVYISMEFAFHNSLPIYAGGLGILAGDICKEASDLGIPLVGVGFMYPQGYFHQHISIDGWQEESYRNLNFDEAPIKRVLNPEGGRPIAKVELDDRVLSVAVWQVRVGRTVVYLLDTDIDENTPEDRRLSARLYSAEPGLRIQQELVLGVGGVRVLRALGVDPAVWHANEGHTTFMMLERVMERLRRGISFDDAVRQVRANTVFTTHTPVPAGHDVFPRSMVERAFNSYFTALDIDRALLLDLGRESRRGDDSFNMTALGLNMAERSLAVSRLHARVTRKMWHGLWPEVSEAEVPISHVTNGVHVPTWISPEMDEINRKYLSPEWAKLQDHTHLWRRVFDIPDEELWAARQASKQKLIHVILEAAQLEWTHGDATAQQVLGLGALLDHHTLTIGYVRRFAEYKRPALVFRDIERLKRIVNDEFRPVQIIFAGKSHPADFPAKRLLRQVYTLATDKAFQGRIAFVEDYDLHTAHFLTQGVDVWLNTPRRLKEACGTSGMKATINGALHLSVRDGWWHEAYSGTNGWAVGKDLEIADSPEEDDDDTDALYRLLEESVVPLYYDQDRQGMPRGWVRKIKESISSITPRFCACRMMKEYAERVYVPTARPKGRKALGDANRSQSSR
ncbi:MAG: alpha-glucan family phosphorylase [Chloroflexi bacterium]|nr:alpha-glucan family phosphorylase [Chloroflexota bacterium]